MKQIEFKDIKIGDWLKIQHRKEMDGAYEDTWYFNIIGKDIHWFWTNWDFFTDLKSDGEYQFTGKEGWLYYKLNENEIKKFERQRIVDSL